VHNFFFNVGFLGLANNVTFFPIRLSL
jgi:hypothetical protein